MTDIAKSQIAGAVQFAGILLAVPFLAVGALIVYPAVMLSEKIHACKYGPEQFDLIKQDRYRLCKTCGNRISVFDE